MTLASGNTTERKRVPERGAPMPFEEFVRVYSLPPIVPPKRCYEILTCGHSKYYRLRQDGKLRIVPRPGGGVGTPAEDIYRLCTGAT